MCSLSDGVLPSGVLFVMIEKTINIYEGEFCFAGY